jgi:hypothetical protein
MPMAPPLVPRENLSILDPMWCFLCTTGRMNLRNNASTAARVLPVSGERLFRQTLTLAIPAPFDVAIVGRPPIEKAVASDSKRCQRCTG